MFDKLIPIEDNIFNVFESYRETPDRSVALMHQANCFRIMGAGIAGQIADKYPIASVEDSKYLKNKPASDKFGNYSSAIIADNMKVINAYSQLLPGAGTDYQKINDILKQVNIELSTDVDIIIPYKYGCGIGGGEWAVVKSIFESVFVDSPRRVYYCISKKHLMKNDYDVSFNTKSIK